MSEPIDHQWSGVPVRFPGPDKTELSNAAELHDTVTLAAGYSDEIVQYAKDNFCILFADSDSWRPNGFDAGDLTTELNFLIWQAPRITVFIDSRNRKDANNLCELGAILDRHGLDVEIVQSLKDAATASSVSTDEYRADLATRRYDAIGNPGVINHDQAGTGRGKSYGDGVALAKRIRERTDLQNHRQSRLARHRKRRANLRRRAKTEKWKDDAKRIDEVCAKSQIYSKRIAGRPAPPNIRSLSVETTHSGCAQKVAMYRDCGFEAIAFPPLDMVTCKNLGEAKAAQNNGLPVRAVACVGCQFRKGCPYLEQSALAEKADHLVATHERIQLDPQLSDNRNLVTIHEIPAGLLRPQIKIKHRAIENIDSLIKIADTIRQWNRTGETEQQELTRTFYYWRMSEVCEMLKDNLRDTSRPGHIEIPHPVQTPAGINRDIADAIELIRESPGREVMSLVRGLLAGNIITLVRRVDIGVRKKGKDLIEQPPQVSVIGLKTTRLNPQAALYISDATSSTEDIEAMQRVPENAPSWTRPVNPMPVVDATPPGKIENQYPIVQIAGRDVYKSSSWDRFIGTIKSLLIALPGFERIGIISHKVHVDRLRDELPKDSELSRLVELGHFRGPDSRGSNKWNKQCDVLVVVGRPLVPPEAIRDRLMITDIVTVHGNRFR